MVAFYLSVPNNSKCIGVCCMIPAGLGATWDSWELFDPVNRLIKGVYVPMTRESRITRVTIRLLKCHQYSETVEFYLNLYVIPLVCKGMSCIVLYCIVCSISEFCLILLIAVFSCMTACHWFSCICIMPRLPQWYTTDLAITYCNHLCNQQSLCEICQATERRKCWLLNIQLKCEAPL